MTRNPRPAALEAAQEPPAPRPAPPRTPEPPTGAHRAPGTPAFWRDPTFTAPCPACGSDAVWSAVAVDARTVATITCRVCDGVAA